MKPVEKLLDIIPLCYLDFQSSATSETVSLTMTPNTHQITSTTTATGNTTGATPQADDIAPGPSSVVSNAERIRSELESIGMLEGVDPSFLAALPDNIRYVIHNICHMDIRAYLHLRRHQCTTTSITCKHAQNVWLEITSSLLFVV